VLKVDVPGWQRLRLDELVLDVNGTLTSDGVLLPATRERVAAVLSILEVRLLSADTFGRLDSIAGELGVAAQHLTRGEPEALQKARVVQELGAERTVAIGNGAK
jgi:soluble P-type ATPase